MPVYAITPEYKGEVKDMRANFGDNQVVYVGWDHHLLFAAPFAYPVPPQMPFKALLTEVMPTTFSDHPEFEQINWNEVEWVLDGQPFIPQMDVSLQDQGIGHKSALRFHTPDLKGFQGAGV